MAQPGSPLGSISNFGGPVDYSLGTPVDPSQQKQAKVEQTAAMKKALGGSPEEQHVLATAVEQGNILGQDVGLDDLQNMDPLELAAKYGVDVALNRHKFAQARQDLLDLKEAQRSDGDATRDAAIDVGVMIANTVGNAAALGVAAFDEVAATPARVVNSVAGQYILEEPIAFAPFVSEGLEDLNEFARGQQSDLKQRRAEQHALEAQLNAQDRETRFEERTAAADQDSFFDRAVVPYVQKTAEAFGDTVINYADDPIMAGALVPEGIGSLIPSTVAIKAAGKANAVRTLTKQGMSKDTAEEFLKTPGGQKLLADSAVKAAPAILAVSEGGAGVTQTQQTIMAMSEEELSEQSPIYRGFRGQGMSHAEAQNRLARDAGSRAGLYSIPGALAAGKIAAPFAASPIAGGGQSALRNTLSEAVEETLQEANTQLASNVALNTSAGLDVDIDEGVADAAAEGFVGGLATSGPLQTPSLVGSGVSRVFSGLKETGSNAAQKVGKALDDRNERKLDEQSPVGTNARSEAAAQAEVAAAEINEALQTTPDQPEAQVISASVNEALYVDEGTADYFESLFQGLKPQDGSPMTRASALEVTGNYLAQNPEADAALRLELAVQALMTYESMRQAESTQTKTAIDSLPEDSPARSAYGTLTEQLRTLEASPAVAAMEEVIGSMTPDDVKAAIPVELLNDSSVSEEDKASIRSVLSSIASINPLAVSQEDYGLVLDQIDPDTAKQIKAAQTAAQIFEEADTNKAEIESDLDSTVAASAPENAAKINKTRRPTVDLVRNDVELDGNADNNLPSLMGHYRQVTGAIRTGRTEDGIDALKNLRDFAQSQANKIGAYNKSARGGKGEKVPFQAFGPYGFFEQTKKAVYAQTKSVNSVATVREVHADAQSAAGLFNTLLEAYGDEIGDGLGPVTVPRLDRSINAATKRFKQLGSKADANITSNPSRTEEKTRAAAQPERRIRKDAVVKTEESLLDTDTSAPEQTTPVQPTPETEDAKAPESEPETTESVEEQAEVQDEAPVREEEGTAEPATGVSPDTSDDVTDTDGDGGVAEDDQSDVVSESPTFIDRIGSRALSTPEGKNYFVEAFNQRRDGSDLSSVEDPIATALERAGELTPEQQSGVSTLVQDTFPGFAKEINDRINAVAAKKGWMQKIAEGKVDVFGSFKEARIMNLVSQAEDGSLELDPAVSAASFMAAMEWVLQNASRGTPYLDDETISKHFGMGRFGVVSSDMREHMQSGVALQSALDAVSAKTMNLLGVSAKDDVSIWHTQGISRSLAANTLEILADMGVLERTDLKVTEPTPKTYTTLSVSEDVRELDLIDQLKTMRDPFTQMFAGSREKHRYVGSAPTRIAPTQLGNKFARLSKLERDVVDRQQKMPSYINTPMLDLIDALGDDVYKSLLGHRVVDDKLRARMNKVHLSSLEGKNTSLDHGIAKTREYIEEARTANQELGDVPIYFEWRVSSVGRLQQQGPVTPQGDKIARELISATNATIDLNNPEYDKAFWLAVAQSLDISVEKNSHADVVREAQDLLDSHAGLVQALGALESFVETGELSETQRQDFIDGFTVADGAIDLTPKAIHALLSVARYRAVAGTSAASEFKTALALEADGKTDGPVNAMVHMGTGEFLPADIERFAKGGFFFTGEPMSLSDFIDYEHKNDPSKKRAEDLYHLAAKRFTDKLTNQLKEGGEQQLTVLRVLDTLLPDFALGQPQNGEYTPEIGRNITKNPLTVFLYGSGERGVAAKVTRQVMDEFYKVLSNIAEGVQDGTYKTWQDHPMFNGDLQFAKDFASIIGRGPLFKALQDPANAEFGPKQVEALTDAIKDHFGDPMLEAVDETTGGLRDNMRLTQAASQVQTAIFQDLLDRKLKEAAAETEGFLSEAQMADVFADTMKIAPIYSTDAQAFHISAPQLETGETSLSESLTGKFSSRTTVMSAKDASVKVSPYLTIGTGDGRMMLNIYGNGSSSLDTSLAVFDGVEQSIDQVNQASLEINKAVYDAWMDGNPYQNIVEGFDQMLEQITPNQFEALSADTKRALRQALKLKDNQALQFNQLRALRDQVQERADSAAARKAVMRQMATSADHMAGAEAPHVVDGVVAGEGRPTAYTEISETMNNLYREEVARVRKERDGDREKPSVQGPSKELRDLVEAVGSPVEGHEGVHRISGAELISSISGNTGASVEQAGVFKDILLKDPVFANATYFVGSNVELEAVRDDLYPDLTKKPIQLGQAHPGAGVAFVANASPETMLHEMLHFHTIGVLNQHYRDPESSEEHVQAAVSRLEALMADTVSLVPTEPNDALTALKTELEAKNGQPAAQMSEFISYMLSNQDLIKAGQKKKVYAPLVRLLREGLQKLKDLLGIRSNPGQTLFSNIRFNTEVLLSTVDQAEPAKQDAMTDLVLEQVYPGNPQLTRIERKFLDRMHSHITASRPADASRPAEVKRHLLKVAETRRMARDAAEKAISQGFRLNPRQAHAFEAIHAGLMVGLELDPTLLRQANDLYRHVVNTVTPENFIVAEGIQQPDTHDQNIAKMQADYLTGARGLRANAEGRTDLLASFIALAQTDDVFRAVLEDIKPPKTVDVDRSSVDGALTSAANSAVNLITRASLTRPTQALNVTRELDRLADGLAEIQGERRMLAAAKMFDIQEKTNDYAAEKISSAVKKTVGFLEDTSTKTNNKVLKAGADIASLVTAIGSKETSEAAGESLTTMLNSVNVHIAPLRELLSDLRGMTRSNQDLVRLINPVKARIDAMRQDFREGIPEELSKRFSRKLAREEWSRMYQGLAKTDLLVLGRKNALEVIGSDAALRKKILEAEERVQSLGGSYAPRYQEKAQALSEYMVSGKVTTNNLLRNSHAIAHLYGEQGNKKNIIAKQVTPQLEKAIGDLVSLYAFNRMDKETKDTLRELAQNEVDGIQTVVGFLHSTRGMETARRDRDGTVNRVAEINGWKGYVPSVTQAGSSVIVADDAKFEELRLKGYVRVADYRGDAHEGFNGTRGYYQSTVAGRAAFRQGVAQTVHESWRGVDARTGQSRTGETAGVLLGSKVDRLARSVSQGSRNGLPAGEYLMPVFNAEGEITAYERPMDPSKMEGLQKDTHLGRMLGVWAGRILEENEADNTNKELVKTLKKIHDDQYGTQQDQFVNIADPNLKDAVIRDAWNSLGWRIKEELQAEFEDGFVPIRRDMVNDAIGYRSATITDPWTGVSRWSPEAQKAIRDTVTRILGVDAFKYLTKSQELLNDAVSFAKTSIIVRSMVVAFDNILSNLFHLSLRGIDPITGAKGLRKKFVEITEYVKNREEIQRLNLDLAANYDDAKIRAKVKAQILALEDANAKLSIKPLIDAGEFSTISENLTEADVAIREGRWADFVEKATDKLPSWAGVAAKNFLITKDTALFQGLNRAVQYGDFVAKAVLYDHLIEEKGVEASDAIDEIAEEFVQYNRLPGRSRDFLESNGLLWFWNYKLRIQKIALKTMRERPLSALTLMGGVGPATGIDTVMSGSLAGAVLDDRIGYSIGPEMGFNSVSLNPWYNLTN